MSDLDMTDKIVFAIKSILRSLFLLATLSEHILYFPDNSTTLLLCCGVVWTNVYTFIYSLLLIKEDVRCMACVFLVPVSGGDLKI